jgi:hypothetical protein
MSVVPLPRLAYLLLMLAIFSCRSATKKNSGSQIIRADSIQITIGDTLKRDSAATAAMPDISILCAECRDTLGIVLAGIQDSFLFIKKESKHGVHLYCYRRQNHAWKGIGDYMLDYGDRWENGDLNFDGKA